MSVFRRDQRNGIQVLKTTARALLCVLLPMTELSKTQAEIASFSHQSFKTSLKSLINVMLDI